MLPLVEIRTLLREHDDPRHRERPRDFDPEVAARRFALLTGRAQAASGRPAGRGCTRTPARADGSGPPRTAPVPPGVWWVELSNFGGFVTAGMGTDWTADSAAGLSGEFVTWLDEVCTAAGCVFVPLDVLLEPYDGPTPTLVDEDRAFARTLAALGHDSHDSRDGHDSEDGEDGEEVLPVRADRYFDYV
ncbi:hypothetical protein STENM36S_04398 [Streptomyces tendae]